MAMTLLAGDDPRVAALRACEPLFHRLPEGSDRAAVEAVAAPSFFEVGASGRRYPRAFVVEVVAARYRDTAEPDDGAWSVDEFQVHELAEPIYLVTYSLVIAGAASRRSTVWQRDGDSWTALYHQGTPSEPAQARQPGAVRSLGAPDVRA